MDDNRYLLNKFWKKYRRGIIVTALFFIFIAFIAPASLYKTARLERRISEMNRERDMYRQQAKADSAFLENLKDDDFLERFARENFYMKRSGEEIYLIKEKQ